MLGSLRTELGARLPMGLTESADARLQKTLHHYVREVTRVKGTVDEREVLRETFDSMAKWLRRNPTEIRVPEPAPVATASTEFQFGSTPLSELQGDAPPSFSGEVADPLAMFEHLKTARAPVLGPPPTVPTEIQLPPELQAIETRPVFRKETTQAKDMLQRQEDVVKYREVETNLILNSKDRNWLENTKENRYSFTVQLDSAYIPTGQNPQITIRNRFRNIVRVEFVKAILPVEGLDVVLPRYCPTNATTPDTAFYSVLSLPYVTVELDEFTGNNIGTNETIDKSLAVCQYDATWRSDQFNSGSTTSRGYTLFFPKFMKAQRTYAPTPLSSFQKLSFQILNPEAQRLSCTPDTAMVKTILFGYDVSGSCYTDPSGASVDADYLFVQTTDWFSIWGFSQLDRVKFDGLTFVSADAGRQTAGNTLLSWLQRDKGHIVVGIAYTNDGVTVVDGANGCGYANMIVVRNRFKDPKVNGVCEPDYFTGTAAGDMVLPDDFRTMSPTLQKGGVLNLSRQVQLVLRVITREMDSATNIRPDNI